MLQYPVYTTHYIHSCCDLACCGRFRVDEHYIVRVRYSMSRASGVACTEAGIRLIWAPTVAEPFLRDYYVSQSSLQPSSIVIDEPANVTSPRLHPRLDLRADISLQANKLSSTAVAPS